MFKKFKTLIIVGATALFFGVPFLAPAVASACSSNVTTGIESGVQAATATGTATTGTCDGGTGTDDGVTGGIEAIAKTAVNIFSIVVGIIAVIMIVYGGFRYITSGGDSGKVGSAKNTLIYAIIGLIIVALAQLIVHYVLNESNSVSTAATAPASLYLVEPKV